MRKFIYGCLLLSFLFTLLYVTPCYAFDENDIKNLIYNYWYNNPTNRPTNWETVIDNYDFSNLQDTQSSTVYHDSSVVFNVDNYKLIAYKYANNNFTFRVYDTTNSNKPSYNNGNINFASVAIFTFLSTTGKLRFKEINTSVVESVKDNILFSEVDIYNNSDTEIVFSSPYSSPSWFTNVGPYITDVGEFTFYINELSTTQYVDLLTDNGIGGIYTFENVPVLYSSNNFGYLVDTLENHVLESDALGFYYLSGSR